MQQSTEIRPIHALMSGLIDFAGLFPPTKLAMADAAQNYAKYLASEESWMLGRFILPVSRLEEFRAAANSVLPRKEEDGPWPLSALIDGELEENLDAVFAFNHEHSKPGNGLAMIDAVEIKVPAGPGGSAAAFIDTMIESVPEGLYPFFEFPVGGGGSDALGVADIRGCIAALAGADVGAKIRTGGVTPDAIPPARLVAEFMLACVAAEVPFKATAGLHHAVRAEHPLTYEQGCPRASTHGFLNVFVCAAMVLNCRFDAAKAAQVLEERDPKAFTFDGSTLSWRGTRLDTAQLERTRELFALSFGSCSFDEPVADLRSLGLI